MIKTRKKAELARALGVNRQTVASWINKGDISCDENGYFNIEEVARFKGKVVRSSGRTSGKRAKPAEVLALVENTELGSREIGEKLGISWMTVEKIKAKYREDYPLVNFMAEKKADLLSIEQAKNHVLRAAILDSIKKPEVLKLGVKDRIQVYTDLGKDNSNSFKDERLYRGETTENVGMIVSFINKMKEGDNSLDKGGE